MNFFIIPWMLCYKWIFFNNDHINLTINKNCNISEWQAAVMKTQTRLPGLEGSLLKPRFQGAAEFLLSMLIILGHMLSAFLRSFSERTVDCFWLFTSGTEALRRDSKWTMPAIQGFQLNRSGKSSTQLISGVPMCSPAFMEATMRGARGCVLQDTNRPLKLWQKMFVFQMYLCSLLHFICLLWNKTSPESAWKGGRFVHLLKWLFIVCVRTANTEQSNNSLAGLRAGGSC